ncbi:MAG: MipA/OmpV family protein [Burkholderiales bacterium]
MRIERSVYRGESTRRDFVPMYMYEGDLVFLRSNSIGLKFGASAERRIELFLRHRFEGHSVEDIPAALAGMAPREPGIDAGVGAQWGGTWGIAYAELLHDVSTASEGSELRLGYKYVWRRGPLSLRPYAFLAVRSSELNDYYYGVRAAEAAPGRPAYEAQSGTGAELGVLAAYQLSGRWRLLAGASLSWLPRTVADSPIVARRTQRTFTLGALYDLSPQQDPWTASRPLIARAFYGASSDCDVMPIATLRCTSTHTQDKTGVVGIEFGRPFIDRLNGWPVDLAGFVGVIRHKEKGFQPDFWQINVYLKAYYYGFPWDARLRTRVGLGVGLAFAEEVPLAERRDQALRGRGTSKLLNTLDPTVDFSLGDLVGARHLRDTYLGVGVSHRSGIFGTSQLLRNVDGGSNYIYGYVESSF